MENTEIEINGKKYNLNELSNEELDALEDYLIEERKVLRKKIDEYLDNNQENNN